MNRLTIAFVLTTLALWVVCPLAAKESGMVDAWMLEQQQSGDLSAAVVADIRGAQIDARGFGRRAPDDARVPGAQTQFQIGSITKVFTNLLLAEMSAAGLVTPSTTLGELLPASFVPRNPSVVSINLLALATHSSGLPRLPANLDPRNTVDPYAAYDEEALLAGLGAARDKQPLGSFYTYSNFGQGALGYLLGRADGAGYRQALQQRVLGPLGLQHTGFAAGNDVATATVEGVPLIPWTFPDAMAGIGALWGSAEDLAHLVQVYLGVRPHRLQHDLLADLEVVMPNAGEFAVTPVWHVARGDGQPIFWHNGGTGGFRSFVGFRPDQQRGIAILVTGDADPTAIGLAALGHVARRSASQALDSRLFGQYQLGEQFGIRVYERDGALVAQATGQPALVIHAVDEAWYAYGDVDASLRFERSEDGAEVVALELAQGGKLHRAARVAGVAAAEGQRDAVPHAASAPGAAPLADYVGRFGFAPGVELRVRRKGQRIEAQLSGQSWFPVFARGADRFFYKVVDAELQFERDADGRVAAVVLHQGGIEQRAARLK